MDDKSKLIETLRMNRSVADSSKASRWPMWAAVSTMIVVLATAAVWLLFRGDATASLAAATAQSSAASVPASRAPQPASMLDASGYVVARRQATVSAAIPGRVVQVLIDEGSRVEKDQVVARLDDAPYLMNLAQV